VFPIMSRTLFLLTLVAAPIAATASEPSASVPARDPRAAQPAPRADRQAPVELICRSVESAGADAAPMVCMTAADWRRAD